MTVGVSRPLLVVLLVWFFASGCCALIYDCIFRRDTGSMNSRPPVTKKGVMPRQRAVLFLLAKSNYWLLLAEGHLTRRLFGSMVRRIAALRVPAG